jgi:hypothetical protein
MVSLKDALSHETADRRTHGGAADVEQGAQLALGRNGTAGRELCSQTPHSVLELVVKRRPILT